MRLCMNKNASASDNKNEILNERQVVDLLGVQPRALRRFRKELGLPYIKISSKVLRFKKSDIDAWLDKHRQVISA